MHPPTSILSLLAFVLALSTVALAATRPGAAGGLPDRAVVRRQVELAKKDGEPAHSFCGLYSRRNDR